MSHPGPHAWTSAQATEPSSQTPGFATATQAGPDTTAPLVNIGERDWRGGREGSVLHVTTQPGPWCDPALGHLTVNSSGCGFFFSSSLPSSL